MSFIGENIKSEGLSNFKDPFGKDFIKTVWFYINNEYETIKYESWVEFKNGDTTGKHKIFADDFVSLVKKTEDFIKSLEKK